MDFVDWDSYFVFNPKDSRLKIYVFDRWTLWIGIVILSLIQKIQDWKFMLRFIIVSVLNLETRCSSSAASQIQWWVQTVLFFFSDFFWRSGLLKYWILSYVQGHCFGCSLRPGMQLNSPCKLASPVLSWSLTLPIWADIVVAQALCLSSTYCRRRKPASLPMVIKLVWV